MLSRISHIVLKYPRFVLAVIIALTAVFAYIAFLSPLKIKVDFSLEQMFPENDPQKDIYQNFLDEFSREDDILFLTYSNVDPLTRENILAVSDITDELEFLEDVESVLSLGNIEYGDYFDVTMSEEEWDNQKQDILHHPIYTNLVISEDGKTGGLIINLQDDVVGQEMRENVINRIHDILDTVPWEWHEAGVPILRTRYVQFVISERKIFLPLAFLVTIFVLFTIFRQVKGILLPLAAIGITLIWVAGLMSLLHITINMVSYLTFNLLMIIGVSNCIHILIKYHENLNRMMKKREALESVIKSIGAALFLTSFTTAVGFFSLMTTNIQITREFGFILGVGVILMFLLTIIILPILLGFINVPDKVHIKRLIQGGRFHAAEKLNNWNEQHPRIIIVSSMLLFFFALLGLTKLDYNASILEDLSPGNPLYENLKFVEAHMGGTLPLEIIIDTGEQYGVLRPDILKGMDELSAMLLKIQEVGYVLSISSHLKILNEKIGSGTRELPDDWEESLSYLIGYEPAENMKNADYSKARISARVVNLPTNKAFEIRDKILAKASSVFPENVDCIVTGSTILALHTNRLLVKNLTISFMIAFVIIFISMIMLFKSLRLAALSILPNIIPLMFAGGLMGYLGIKLRPSTAMTFSIALGIAVDDTIHFLSRFRQEYRKTGNYHLAINRTLLTTGKAIISTTIILSLGFFVLVFSQFVPNHEFGILATIILLVALCGSLILLPVLILLVKPKLRFRNKSFNTGTGD